MSTLFFIRSSRGSNILTSVITRDRNNDRGDPEIATLVLAAQARNDGVEKYVLAMIKEYCIISTT